MALSPLCCSPEHGRASVLLGVCHSRWFGGSPVLYSSRPNQRVPLPCRNYEDVPLMKRPDLDFGVMEYNGIDAWDCRVQFSFPHKNTQFFAIHLWARENGPTEKQRLRLRGLKNRYESLWPEIASRIITVHERLRTTNDVGAAMSERLSVHIGEHAEDSVEIVIDIKLPGESYRGYFISLEEWKIGNAVPAD